MHESSKPDAQRYSQEQLTSASIALEEAWIGRCQLLSDGSCHACSFPAGMAKALDLHDKLVRSHLKRFHGREVSVRRIVPCPKLQGC